MTKLNNCEAIPQASKKPIEKQWLKAKWVIKIGPMMWVSFAKEGHI
jgi:hypothetical protein